MSTAALAARVPTGRVPTPGMSAIAGCRSRSRNREATDPRQRDADDQGPHRSTSVVVYSARWRAGDLPFRPCRPYTAQVSARDHERSAAMVHPARGRRFRAAMVLATLVVAARAAS